MLSFRRKIYIKVYRGYFQSRESGSDNDLRTDCIGLSHNRTLLGDWREIEASLKQVLKKHCGIYDKLIKPIVLLHLVPSFEGGYTSSELRLFQEIGQSAGAHFCLLCEDKYGPLSNEQIKSVFNFW